jgi:hypothetical protein
VISKSSTNLNSQRQIGVLPMNEEFCGHGIKDSCLCIFSMAPNSNGKEVRRSPAIAVRRRRP